MQSDTTYYVLRIIVVFAEILKLCLPDNIHNKTASWGYDEADTRTGFLPVVSPALPHVLMCSWGSSTSGSSPLPVETIHLFIIFTP